MKFTITFDSYIMNNDTIEFEADTQLEAGSMFKAWLESRGMDTETPYTIEPDHFESIKEIMENLPIVLAGAKSLNGIINDNELKTAIEAIEKYFEGGSYGDTKTNE